MRAGAVVEMDGLRQAFSRKAGRGTNNQAEYEGLALGLHQALQMGASSAVIRGASQRVINQLQGRAQVTAPALAAAHQKAVLLMAQFDSTELEWVAREQNHEARVAADRAA